MIITTLFARDAGFDRGEVEVKLMPGIPHLHVVGLPDRSIRECGVRIKSALKSSGFAWPRGHQIIVNLRPSYSRKQSAGIDLAVALGVLIATRQLDPAVAAHLDRAIVYGELALDGRVFGPADVDRALGAVGADPLLTGEVGPNLREGRWLELPRLNTRAVVERTRTVDPAVKWVRPALEDIRLTQIAFDALWISAHLELNVLVAGPQGSGKSTWARALHALSRPPLDADVRARAALFGQGAIDEPWRPLERPHHTSTALALIGGGRPLRPGVMSRAHGGTLIMDEFLEFDPPVLEALREPMENGVVDLARSGARERWPARAQLIGTTNLCPCGELNPDARESCRFGVGVCRRVCSKLSGPVLDRFDLLVPSHEWLRPGPTVALTDAPALLARLDRFALARASAHGENAAAGDPTLSHRRRRAVARVARGLADFDEADVVTDRHLQRAYAWVVSPMENLRKVFG